MTTTQKTTDVTARRCSHWWWTVPGCLAMVLLNAAVSYGIVRLNAPVTVAFNMKQTVDAFFDSASQKQRKRKLTAVCSHQTRIGNLDAHLI